MKVHFAGNVCTDVFSDMPKPSEIRQKTLIPKTKSDTFERAGIKEKVIKNKKYIAGAAIAAAVIISAGIMLKKNPPAFLKELLNKTPAPAEPQGGITEGLVKNAKKFLIDDVKNYNEASANGICFYGPDSIGKERALEGFIKDLSDAGYRIKRAPRVKDTPIKDIGISISRDIKEAEKLFKETNQRTAIIIRDLDKVALERTENGPVEVTRVLIDAHKCRERGYACITEAVDPTVVDSALRRRGRMEHQIISRPCMEDSPKVWQTYKDFLNKLKDGEKKEALIKEAQSYMEQKGMKV